MDSDTTLKAPTQTAKSPEFPEHLLRKREPYRPGIRRVPVDRFFKQEYHDLEVEKIWKKSWQWACREEEIPEVGDYMVYEVATLSFIVMRTGEKEFKAYWNSCPHRARKICTFDGKRATEIRCMFHGWAWNIDGKMKDMNGGSDFPGIRSEEVNRLPEARTGVWGGFVFINPDLDCESLESFLGELPDHFENAGHDLSKRWKQVHVVARLNANWKVTQEAFLEAWHAGITHPQLLTPAAIDGAPRFAQQWDDFGNWMRWTIVPMEPGSKLVPTGLSAAETEQQYVNSHYDFHMNEDPPIKLAEGENGYLKVQETIRETHRKTLGDAIDDYHDYYMNAGEMLMIWPNFHPWQGFTRLMYRFRPYKNDPCQSLMDILLLAPWPEDRPRPEPMKAHVLEPGQPITDAPELGQLARIFAQDLGNIPMVQEGLMTSKNGYVILSNSNEAPLRHWHDRYDMWMGLDNTGGKIGDEA